MGERYHTLTEAFFNREGEESRIIIVDKENRVWESNYKTMISEAKKFAGYFAENHIQKGDKIVLAVSDIRIFLPAFWGAVYIGAVVIPVIPPQSGGYRKGKQDTQRLVNILQVTAPKCIVSVWEEKESMTDIVEGGTDILQVSKEIIESGKELTNDFHAEENDTVVILFTSGSTGIPKGVEITHKKALEGCYQNIEYFSFSHESSFLNWLPLEHVASLMLFHLIPCVLKATQVQVCTNVILADSKKWLYYLYKYQIQATVGPNFIYKMLLDMQKEIEKMNVSLSSLRVLINGGEAIHYKATEECVHMLEKKGMPRGAMIPGWGMTEIGTGAIYSFQFGKVLYENCVAIGKPVSGIQVRIVKDGQVVTQDEVEGSLQIKGDFILDGYLNESKEEHAERFLDGGWFKTGDLAVQKSGELVITGRESQIYIMNGMNISLNEIESHVVNSLSEEHLCTTLKVTNIKNTETNHDELYVFMEEKEGLDKEVLISKVKRYITDRFEFSVRHIVFVPENKFPRTPIGKIDTKVLIENMKNNLYVSEIDREALETKRNSRELASDEENLLLFIWAEALNIDKANISIHDDFFSIGGDSAKVPGVLNKIHLALGVDLDAAEFVRYPTIHELLAYIHAEEDLNESEEEEMIIL